MKRLTTRGIATAEAIRDREDFRTSGALMAEEVGSMHRWQSGQLSGPDLDQFNEDCTQITYVVMSYSTPIAWYVGDEDRWHTVSQKFSRTTTKHQGTLYLIPTEARKRTGLTCDGLPLDQTTCPDRAGHM